MFFIFNNKIPPCSPTGLDCVERITVGKDECLEHCEGTILDVAMEGLTKDGLDEETHKQIVAEYENYKYPNSSYLPYPEALRCRKVIFI